MKHWKEYTGFEWLLIDVASRFGLDKETNDVRIQWSVETVLPLVKLAEDTNELTELLAPLIDTADERPMFTGACLGLWDTVNGRVSTWQVGQDAASSGPALLSTLLKDVVGMRYCGILGNTVPDLYTSVTNAMNDSKYNRKIVKKGIVPHVYASEAEPKKVFGKAYPKFLKAYKSIVNKAQEASDFMVKAWNSYATEHRFTMPDGAEIVIPVIIKKKKSIPCGKYTFEYIYDDIGNVKQGKAGTKGLSANSTHSYDGYILRELNRRCNYDPALFKRCYRLLTVSRDTSNKPVPATDRLIHLEELYYKFNQASAVAFEYLDEANVHNISQEYADTLIELLEASLSHAPFEVSNIHDEFKTLPNYVCNMKIHYNTLMVETYFSNWWTTIAHDLTGKDVRFMAHLPLNSIAEEIQDAEYSIG